MSNTWYDKVLTRVGKGLLSLDALSNPKIILIEDSKYIFSQGHEYLSDIPADARIATTGLINSSFGGDLSLPEDMVAHWDMGTITGGKDISYDNVTEGINIGLEVTAIPDANPVETVGVGIEVKVDGTFWAYDLLHNYETIEIPDSYHRSTIASPTEGDSSAILSIDSTYINASSSPQSDEGSPTTDEAIRRMAVASVPDVAFEFKYFISVHTAGEVIVSHGASVWHSLTAAGMSIEVKSNASPGTTDTSDITVTIDIRDAGQDSAKTINKTNTFTVRLSATGSFEPL